MRRSRTALFVTALLVMVAVAAAVAQTAGTATKTTTTTAAKSATPAKASASSAKGSPSSGKLGVKTIAGDIIDPSCWVMNGAKGEAHKECMVACAKAGQTLAILEKKTNKVYILAAERPGEDPNKSVLDYAGMPVLVKGKVYTRGGIMAIQVASIEPYSAAKAAAK
ncbi:MAG TPA: hypothetical protein VL857_01745 [Candidatus Eisenbacteria bacterium]|jgi:hypothetical protein|nr:hypothetical protein [Candidatus Eisenbacteria bacterium]